MKTSREKAIKRRAEIRDEIKHLKGIPANSKQIAALMIEHANLGAERDVPLGDADQE